MSSPVENPGVTTEAWPFEHHHGWCRRCKASRASADIQQGESFCPVCGTFLAQTTLHEPHDPPITATLPREGVW